MMKMVKFTVVSTSVQQLIHDMNKNVIMYMMILKFSNIKKSIEKIGK